MKKHLDGIVFAALFALTALLFTACEGSFSNPGLGDGASGDPITSNLYGKYSVTSPAEAVGHTITVEDGTWSMSGHTVNSDGTYTLSADQKTATLYAHDVSGTVGTVYISGVILTGILNSASNYPGTYKAKKISD